MTKKDYPFVFNPDKKGIRKVLGELESEIMELIWGKDEVTVRQIYEILMQKRKIAYTTVMTTMSRLAEKGLLHKRSDGVTHFYKATSTEDEFTKSSIKKVLSGILDEISAPVISKLVDDVNKEDEAEMEKRARLIKQKRKDRDV